MEGRVKFKGNIHILHQLQGGLRSSMGYIGAKNLSDIQKMLSLLKLQKLVFMKVWFTV